MSVKEKIGRVVLVVVAIPLMLLVVALAFAQQSDEVDANSITTGKVVDHKRNPNSSTGLCNFSYTVDGSRYEAQDNCVQDDNPIGTEVTVNYVADKPSAGFLHGDKTWWDKVKTILQAGAVLAVVIGSTVLLIHWPKRGAGTSG